MTKRFVPELAQVHAVDRDAASCDVIQTEDQTRQRGFAAPGAAQQSQHGTRCETEGQALQDGIAAIVGKAHILERQRQGTGRNVLPVALHNIRLEAAEFGQALHTGADGLEGFDLVRHGPERLLQQVDVMDKQVDRADGDQPGAEQPVTASDGKQRAEGECQPHRIFDDPALEVGPAVVGQDARLVTKELTDRIIHRPARTHILHAGQLLFEEAIHLCFGLPPRPLVRDGNIL